MNAAQTALAGVSRPLHRILTELTGEPRLDVAVGLGVNDLARLRLRECQTEIKRFESKYGKSFEAFKAAWEAGRLPHRHSYEVERDYWEWEAAVSNRDHLLSTLEKLP